MEERESAVIFGKILYNIYPYNSAEKVRKKYWSGWQVPCQILAYFLLESLLILEESPFFAAESASIFSTALRILSAELAAEVSCFDSDFSVVALLQARVKAKQDIKRIFFIGGALIAKI